MSARPPFDSVPREPLDAEETALARVHRALPGLEPPAQLDARILAQARAAVAPRKARPRPWFLGAGFGAAATAVMAAGIAWQLGWIGGIPGTAERAPAAIPAPQDTNASGAGAEPERVDIEFYREERAKEIAAPEPAAAPTAVAPAPDAPLRRQAMTSAPVEAKASSPPPPLAAASASADAIHEATPVILAEPAPAPQAFPAEGAAAAETMAPLPADAPARSFGAERERSDRRQEEDASLDTIVVTGTRLGKQRASLPAWTEDSNLDPEAWLERVRERLRLGDRQSAEHSLRRFVLTHPRQPIPDELQRLLVE